MPDVENRQCYVPLRKSKSIRTKFSVPVQVGKHVQALDFMLNKPVFSNQIQKTPIVFTRESIYLGT